MLGIGTTGPSLTPGICNPALNIHTIISISDAPEFLFSSCSERFQLDISTVDNVYWRNTTTATAIKAREQRGK